MDRKERLALLRKNPVFWSRLGFCYDPPLKNAEGRPLVFTEDLSRYGKYHRDFCKAGVHIHTCILHAGWMGVEEYDYSLTDRVLDEVFASDPDGYFIPRIKVNVPIDWCYENPEELFVYPEGPATAEEIRALVGTEKQDYIGYEAPNGYYMAGDFVDPRPNVGGVIARQSFASKKWLADASIALGRVIDRLESSKYADRILGYQIGYGSSGECVMWGRVSARYGDYGICFKRAFYAWGLKKYGTREALAEAWCQPCEGWETLRLPTPEERYGVKDTVTRFFRGEDTQKIAVDMDLFHSKINADAILHFGEVVKAHAPEKLYGAFYGYFLHVNDAAYAGHLAIDRILDSSAVDFIAAPKSYYRTQAGDPGGALSATMSINRKKLWLDELDNRTHLATGVEAGWESDGLSDTRTVFWREVAKNLADGSGFWWMDLGGGWFDHPDIMAEFARLTKSAARVQEKPWASASDILVLVDEDSLFHMNISEHFRLGFMEDFVYELRMTGCLFDLYRLSDLDTLDLARYKLVIFAHTFKMAKKQREVVKSLAKDKTLMFNYAAGAISDGDVSLENTARLTGVSLLPSDKKEYDFPTLAIDEGAHEVLLRDDGGNARCVRTADGMIVNTKPYLSARELRAITDLAGCHAYAPVGNTVYGDSRFIGVFTGKNVGLSAPVVMKEEGKYIELIRGKRYDGTATLSCDLPPKGAAFFLKEN